MYLKPKFVDEHCILIDYIISFLFRMAHGDEDDELDSIMQNNKDDGDYENCKKYFCVSFR